VQSRFRPLRRCIFARTGFGAGCRWQVHHRHFIHQANAVAGENLVEQENQFLGWDMGRQHRETCQIAHQNSGVGAGIGDIQFAAFHPASDGRWQHVAEKPFGFFAFDLELVEQILGGGGIFDTKHHVLGVNRLK